MEGFAKVMLILTVFLGALSMHVNGGRTLKGEEVDHPQTFGSLGGTTFPSPGLGGGSFPGSGLGGGSFPGSGLGGGSFPSPGLGGGSIPGFGSGSLPSPGLGGGSIPGLGSGSFPSPGLGGGSFPGFGPSAFCGLPGAQCTTPGESKSPSESNKGSATLSGSP